MTLSWFFFKCIYIKPCLSRSAEHFNNQNYDIVLFFNLFSNCGQFVCTMYVYIQKLYVFDYNMTMLIGLIDNKQLSANSFIVQWFNETQFLGGGGRSRVKANWRARFLNVSLIITTLETIHSIEVRCVRV